VLHNINVGMERRLKLVGQLLRDKVVINISIPVVKQKSSITGRIIVTERSKPGEFPRADTTNLMKHIYSEYHEETMSVHVGTNVDYGLWLETLMNRGFLRRSLLEMEHELGVTLGSAGGGDAGPLPGQGRRH